MPNHCQNRIEITLPSEVAQLLVEHLKKTDTKAPLCSFFKPMPPYLLAVDGFKDGWYEWASREWDTKWGDYDGTVVSVVPATDPIKVRVISNGPDGERQEARRYNNLYTVTYTFMSAWNPPIAVVSFIASLGYGVYFSYYEAGMGFGGRTPYPENGSRTQKTAVEVGGTIDLEEFVVEGSTVMKGCCPWSLEALEEWCEEEGFSHGF